MSRRSRSADWLRRRVPKREQFQGNRWLRPVAHRVLAPSLWRFTRRSVPRGVALGMLAGMIVPVAQIPLSAILALPFRANIPAAALTTFITNPLTMPFFWMLAYRIGEDVLRMGDAPPAIATSAPPPDMADWLHWLFAQAGPATMLGLSVMAVVGAAIGYVFASVAWRLWIAHKWKHRHRRAD